MTTAAVTLALSILKRNLVSPERKLDYRLHELALGDPTFEHCMAHLLGPPLVDGNRVTSLLNGDEIFPATALQEQVPERVPMEGMLG
jgi:cardiolipin synthase